MKYTVLILRPDYVASEYGKDTYLAHVEEVADVKEAEQAARLEAWSADQVPDVRDLASTEGIEDYHVLFVAEGLHDDLRSGE